MTFQFPRPHARPAARVALAAAAALATCLAFVPATLAQNTGDPFADPIPVGATVGVTDVVALPNSDGAPARMNSSAVAPDGRFFVLDQRGPVYNVTGGAGGAGGAASQYLNLNNFGLNLLNDNRERGFSQIAFHPQFNQSGTPGFGRLYASFSTSNTSPTPTFTTGDSRRPHDEVVYELRTNNPAASTFQSNFTPRQVLRLAQPLTNHNGGGLGFNPNATPGTPDFGALYYSSGDGGGGGDPLNQGQNAATPFGALLRIDPLGSGGTGDYGIVADNAFASDGNPNTLAENYAFGFRNPQRFSFDTGGTGRLLLGDVGQGVIEEVDDVVNGGNYGWVEREGSFVYISGGTVAFPPNPENPAFINPIAEYDHSEGSAVSGGFVYRGDAIPELTDKYVFGDLVNGRVFYIDADQDVGGRQSVIQELLLTEDMGATSETLLALINDTPGVSSNRADLRLGQDALGNIYLLNKRDGIVRALTPLTVPEPASAAILLGGGLLLLRRRHR